MKMKHLFVNYENKVLRNEERALNPSFPRAYNSSASQGNYLEVINMSLNGKKPSLHSCSFGILIFKMEIDPL